MDNYFRASDILDKAIGTDAYFPIKSILLGTKTADVAPVRRGRWIHPHWCNSVSAADCSECGAEAHHIEYRGVQKYYKICPSCGARMDKEDEHEAD